MRLDRHDRFKKALKKFNASHEAFWNKEMNRHPHYRLDIQATAPRYHLKSIDVKGSIRARSIGAFVHWIALQWLLNKPYPGSERGAFIGNLVGFPEITLLDYPHDARFFMPFKVKVVYKTQPIDFFEFLISTSKLLGCDEVDLMKPQWDDPREQVSEFEEESAEDRSGNWVLQTQKRNSRLFRNRDQLIESFWKTFVNRSDAIASKPTVDEKCGSPVNINTDYPFAPLPGETLVKAMLETQKFVATTASVHYQRIAKKWLQVLIKKLFFKTRLTVRQESIILSYFGIDHPSYGETILSPLTLGLSEYPIDYKRAEAILDVLQNEFLLDAKKYRLSGELFLVLLIALQGAYRRPRMLSIEQILGLTTAEWEPKNESFNFGNWHLKLSNGLTKLVLAFAPRGDKQKRKLFKLSRSWINKRLREINTLLGYDWDNDAVSAQTFLVRPYQHGPRGRPTLWGVAGRVRIFQYFKFYPAKNKTQDGGFVPPPAKLKIRASIRSETERLNHLKLGSVLTNLPPLKNKFKAFMLNALK